MSTDRERTLGREKAEQTDGHEIRRARNHRSRPPAGVGRVGGDGVHRSFDFSGGYITDDGVVEQIDVAQRRGVPPFEGDTLVGSHFDTDEAQPAPYALAHAARSIDGPAKAIECAFSITYPSITTGDSGPPLLALGVFSPQGAVPSTIVVDRTDRRPPEWWARPPTSPFATWSRTCWNRRRLDPSGNLLSRLVDCGGPQPHTTRGTPRWSSSSTQWPCWRARLAWA